MPWMEKTNVALRDEFVQLASQEGAVIAELCRRYQVSRKTGYKWLQRYRALGQPGLEDQSRRPHESPRRCQGALVDTILALRAKYPYWGARKLRAVLRRSATNEVPSSSTIHKILKTHGFIHEANVTQPHVKRFEHEAPNHLWQMDFKGHFPYEQGRCHPLTVLDDHSRFSLVLHACPNERGQTIQPVLIEAFRRYGLPCRINVDNGAPWGSLYDCARYTTFSLWLIRLGIHVSYSRPSHPQTNGKEERFHRTLKLELLTSRYFKSLEAIQGAFDDWRDQYNLDRPHEGIGMQVPSERYRPSYRPYLEVLPEIEYADDVRVKTVDCRGRIRVDGRILYVGTPFAGEPIGIRHQGHSETIAFYYAHQKFGEVDMRQIKKHESVNLYSGQFLSSS